jgi:hypothetical protein
VVNKDRSEILLNQLKNAFLQREKCVTIFQSSENPNHHIIVIKFPGDVLDQMAELIDLKCKLQDSNHVLSFKVYAKDLFDRFQAR